MVDTSFLKLLKWKAKSHSVGSNEKNRCHKEVAGICSQKVQSTLPPGIKDECLPIALGGIPSLFCQLCSDNEEECDEYIHGKRENSANTDAGGIQAAESKKSNMEGSVDRKKRSRWEQQESSNCDGVVENNAKKSRTKDDKEESQQTNRKQQETVAQAGEREGGGVVCAVGLTSTSKRRKTMDDDATATAITMEQLHERIGKLESELSSANNKVELMTKRLKSAGIIISDSVHAIQDKEKENRKLQKENKVLQEENKTLRQNQNNMKEQLATASAALETVSSKLSNKEKEVRSKNAQVQYHRKVREELEQEMQSKTFKLPKSASTRINAQQIVATIRAILETTTARMQDNSENSKYLFEHPTELLLDETIHGGQLARGSYNVFCMYVRQNVFPAHKVLKHVAFQGGVLNFEGIETLREIETGGGGGQSYVSTLLPSTAELQKVASIVVLRPQRLSL
ncbi:hypothetical protein ACA910_007484 [Epithemia clementina (nom. ined.)]